MLGGAEELIGMLITPALGGTLLGVTGDFTDGGGGRLGGPGRALFTSGIPRPDTTTVNNRQKNEPRAYLQL
jgi:hypothetical protein